MYARNKGLEEDTEKGGVAVLGVSVEAGKGEGWKRVLEKRIRGAPSLARTERKREKIKGKEDNQILGRRLRVRILPSFISRIIDSLF